MRPGPRQRFSRWRNGLVRQPRFISLVQRIPLLRGLARKQAGELFGMMTGFVHTQVLLACVELDVLALLRDEPRNLADIADHCGVPVERMQRLLDAAMAMGLLESAGPAAYGLSMTGASLEGDPGLLGLARHHQALYADLLDPVEFLRNPKMNTQLGSVWPYAQSNDPGAVTEQEARRYSELMGQSQAMVAEQVLRSFDFSDYRSLLDVGGGDGSFLRAVAGNYATLSLRLFDLPAVADIARQRFAQASLETRSEVFGGNFHQDQLPTGQELISLVRILHDHDDQPVRDLLARVHAALVPGGTLLLAEPMSGTPGAEAMGDAYFGIYLLAMGSGRPRSFTELKGMLEATGFQNVRQHPTSMPLICSVMSARRGQ